MSYRDGVAVGDDRLDARTDLAVHKITSFSLVGTNDVANNLLAPSWRRRATTMRFDHAVILVQMPDVSTVLGDSPPSLANWLYATPTATDPDQSHVRHSDGTHDHYGAGIVALRSEGGILFLPHGGEWDIYYPDSDTARIMVLDGRHPPFVDWIVQNFRCYHALSLHPSDVAVPAFTGLPASVVTAAVGSRWRRKLVLQNVGPAPDTTPAVVASDPPIRVWTTTSPTDIKGIILYPRDKLELKYPEPMVAHAWKATAIGGATNLSVSAWV
jgi:hypothetical protein